MEFQWEKKKLFSGGKLEMPGQHGDLEKEKVRVQMQFS